MAQQYVPWKDFHDWTTQDAIEFRKFAVENTKEHQDLSARVDQNAKSIKDLMWKLATGAVIVGGGGSLGLNQWIG